MSRVAKSLETESRLMLSIARVGDEGGGMMVTECGDENVLEVDSGDGCTALRICQSTEFIL